MFPYILSLDSMHVIYPNISEILGEAARFMLPLGKHQVKCINEKLSMSGNEYYLCTTIIQSG